MFKNFETGCAGLSKNYHFFLYYMNEKTLMGKIFTTTYVEHIHYVEQRMLFNKYLKKHSLQLLFNMFCCKINNKQTKKNLVPISLNTIVL